MRNLVAGGLALVLLVWAGSAHALMYGSVGPQSPTNPGAVLIVDETNGSGALLGTPVTSGGLSGLAFNSSVSQGGAPGSNLLKIDPATGSLIQNLGPILQGGNDVGISDLAFQPGTDVLFGIASFEAPCAYCLYTIDTATAVASLVGDPGLAVNGGLAFDPNGVLYLATSFPDGNGFPDLVTLDPTNASPTGSIDTDRTLDGLGIRPTDGAFFATGTSGSDDILRVDPVTGLTTIIGQTGAGSTTDLDFVPIPEPGSGLLLGSALAALSLLRRRRR
jgi:hypothetical protein